MPAIIGRASLATAQTSFAGESLIVVPWSGNYELVFKKTVIDPFNAQYGTKVESVGGWDQMVPQIIAAPADNPHSYHRDRGIHRRPGPVRRAVGQG